MPGLIRLSAQAHPFQFLPVNECAESHFGLGFLGHDLGLALERASLGGVERAMEGTALSSRHMTATLRAPGQTCAGLGLSLRQGYVHLGP